MPSRQTANTESLWQFCAPRYWHTWLGLGAMWMMSRLPNRAQQRFGCALGSLVRRLPFSYVRIAQRNIDLCFPELNDEQLAYLRGESRCCASCRGPLLPGQPEGACCKNCTNRIMRTRTHHNRQMATVRVLTLVIIGCAAGVFLVSILLLVLR